MELTFEIELLSDYHIGAGHGRGELIDSALFRDSDHVPAIRGTVLAGLLRDGLRELLKHPALKKHAKCRDALGESEGREDDRARYCRDEACAVCRIFGSPYQAKRWEIGSARPVSHSVPRRDSLRGPTPSAQVVSRASIDPRTRRTEPGKLFASEHGSYAMTFSFTATCTQPHGARRDAALLVAAARMVRQLGRSRRRGLGACRIRLCGETDQDTAAQDAYLDLFRETWLEDKPDSAALSSESPASWETPSSDTERPLRLRLLLRTDEPVLIAEGQQAGNQIEGLSYIPGTVVMGAFAAQAARRWDLTDVDGELYRAFVRVFRRGRVRFPTLYPAVRSADRLCPTIPAPADLLTCQLFSKFDDKLDSSSAHGSIGPVAGLPDIPAACPDCQGRSAVPLEPAGGYLSLQGNPKVHQVRMRDEMHVRIDPHTKTASAGNLFSYLAIDAGQYFLGELEFYDQQAQADFLQLVGLADRALPWNLSLRLGRAIRRGYGQVRLAVEDSGESREPAAAASSLHVGLPLPSRVTAFGEPIVLTFLTDAILTDPWGRFRHSVDPAWIRDELLAGVPGDVELVNQFMSVRAVDGFFSHLGRPRHRELAIAAGSAVGFRLVGDLDDQRKQQVLACLQQREREGVGLRRGEGFGRIAFNHPIYDHGKSRGPRATIPEFLKLDASHGSGLEGSRDFASQWTLALDSVLKPAAFSDARWLAIAHWLRSRAAGGIAAIRDELARLNGGEPDAGAASCPGTPNHLFHFSATAKEVFREKNFFAADEQGQLGVTCLLDALNRLQKLAAPDGPPREQLGLNMLAQRVAGLARNAKQKES
jgi:CRISPR-associated protein Csx10